MDKLAGNSQPRKCSTLTPDGCQIKCLCDNVFTVTQLDRPAECPGCKRTFAPGYDVQMTILSKRSGMPIGFLKGSEPAATPDEAAAKAAARAYDAKELERTFWKVEASEPAFFDPLRTKEEK
jgi:hypothetical protein